MFAATYLQDDTFNQMQSHLKDFLKNSHSKREDNINKIFNKFSEFKKQIRIVSKEVNTKCTTERKLMSLQQKESAVSYATEF